MARKRPSGSSDGGNESAGAVKTSESKIEEFAADLGHVLGIAQNKAESWLEQRGRIAEQLTTVRDTANKLLAQLTGATTRAAGVGRGRPRGSKNKAGKKKRTMSAAARKAISDAQKKRWAAQKAAKK